MDNIPTISTEKLLERYNTLENNVNRLFAELYGDHQKALKANPIYRKYSFFSPIWSLILIAFAGYHMIFNQKMMKIYFGHTGGKSEIVKGILVMIIFVNIVNIIRWAYSKKLDGMGRKIVSCRRTAEKRIEEMKKNDFYGQVSRAAESGDTKFSVEQPNDLGDRICALKKVFSKENRKAATVRKFISPLLAAVYFLFGFVMVIMNRDEIAGSSAMTLWMLLFAVYTYFAIDVVLCHVGGYLGGAMRIFGLVLAAVTCGFELWAFSGADLDEAMFNVGNIPVVSSITQLQFAVILQFASMLLSVLKADYLGMRTKWNKGFALVMKYGEDKEKNCGSVKFRGTIAGILAWFSWTSGLELAKGGKVNYLMFPLLFWLSMPLMKPFGSTIYTFFGRAKSISITLFSFAMYVVMLVNRYGSVDRSVLISWAVCAGLYIAIGGVVKFINDETMAFDFMHKFT